MPRLPVTPVKNRTITSPSNPSTKPSGSSSPTITSPSIEWAQYGSKTDVYVDKTKGPIGDTDRATKGYHFNPPIINRASASSLPNHLYPGPGSKKKGYLFQDPQVTIDSNLDITPAADGSMHTPLKFSQSSRKYGFKFMYNPPEVGMGVGFAAGVDIKQIANNLDASANPLVPQAGSTIQFDLLINRAEDLALGSSLRRGHYPDGSISNSDLARIRDKGTMADIEYLLLTLNSGMKLDTKYRGRTADIGWLIGGPIVLKLGPSLVYQCLIDNVSINHTRFTSNMIPSMTAVQLSMSRYVDVVGGSTSKSYNGRPTRPRPGGAA